MKGLKVAAASAEIPVKLPVSSINLFQQPAIYSDGKLRACAVIIETNEKICLVFNLSRKDGSRG